jgi:hypothetical protein
MDKWLFLLSSPFEEERIYAASKVQELLYRDIPYIVYSRAGAWYQYRIDYWIGWPNASNPWLWTGTFLDSNFPIFFGLASKVKGEKPTVPWWVKPTDQGGLMIPLDTLWKQIVEILKSRPIVITTTPSPTTPTPSPTTTPTPTTTPSPTTPTPSPTTTPTPTTTPVTGVATITVIVTQSVEKTVISTVAIPSTVLSTISTTVREIEWTTTTLLAVILFIVGLAIGIFIKRK